jgi:hypothetical protein
MNTLINSNQLTDLLKEDKTPNNYKDPKLLRIVIDHASLSLLGEIL